MNTTDYENKRIMEIRRYSRMMGFEDDESARGRTFFQKFSLLRRVHLKEGNHTLYIK